MTTLLILLGIIVGGLILIGVVMTVLLLVIMRTMGSVGAKLAREAGGGRNRPGVCSFCSRSHHDVGPLVEGPNYASICASCCQSAQATFREGSHPLV